MSCTIFGSDHPAQVAPPIVGEILWRMHWVFGPEQHSGLAHSSGFPLAQQYAASKLYPCAFFRLDLVVWEVRIALRALSRIQLDAL
ncbi:MAG: hypothetical protein AAF226_05850 [Verrucomicrobiota bacterium]